MNTTSEKTLGGTNSKGLSLTTNSVNSTGQNPVNQALGGNANQHRPKWESSRSPIEKVLSALAKVKRRANGNYSACCPAHDDKSPSLSIRETTEGAVLLHCFAGCNVSAIVGAMGLETQELFPPRERSPTAPPRLARLLTAGQALELLEAEALQVAVAAANVLHGVILHQRDIDRLSQAAGRIGYLRQETAELGGRHD